MYPQQLCVIMERKQAVEKQMAELQETLDFINLSQKIDIYM